MNVKETLRLAAIPKPLLEWYDRSRRILPWREEPTPYHVWVSEIMLQQTRVEAVKPYYDRFITALPDIRSLAEAEEEQLLKLWEGLGYYNRVRNLQKAATQIQSEYSGKMPGDYEELLKLKGIGSYTAGAIASIAFGVPRPAVDGNVLRVISRVRKDERLITEQKVKFAVEEELLEIIPRDRPGDFNQAMMEIGACICIPNGAPHCEECPLSGICLAHEDGVETDFPRKTVKKPRSIEEKTVLIIRDGERIVLHKRGAKGLLAGLYEFPNLAGHLSEEEVLSYVRKQDLVPVHIEKLEDAKHIFSHIEWHMTGYMVRVSELETEQSGLLFVEVEDSEKRYPIPAAFAAYTKYMNLRLGNDRFSADTDQ